jgi:hypothetical protein
MNSVDGLWTAEFGTANGWTSGGVLVFDQGRLFGGGDRYYCVGHFGMHRNIFSGELWCHHFHGPSMDAFNTTFPEFRLSLRGRLTSDFIDGQMHHSDRPGQTLPFRLIRRAALPEVN